jgi:hypothetical protein
LLNSPYFYAHRTNGPGCRKTPTLMDIYTEQGLSAEFGSELLNAKEILDF